MPLVRRLALAAALLTLSAPALAADPAPAAKPAESKPAAVALKPGANELARVLMPKKTWDEGLAALAKNVQAQMTTHPGAKLDYPADFGKQVRAELDAALPYEALLDLHAKELSASYTEPELKDLLAFYNTPTGQKSLQAMPVISEKVAIQTQQRVESKMPAIMQKLSSKVKGPAGAKGGKAAPSPHGGMPPGHGAMPPGHGAPEGQAPAASKPAAPASPAKK